MRQKVRELGRPEPTLQNYADAAAVGERIREAIEKIITLDGSECKACGLWVWVGGKIDRPPYERRKLQIDSQTQEAQGKPTRTDRRERH